MNDNERLLTPSEVASALACCTETVLRAVRAGELRAVRLGRNLVRIAVGDLRAYIATRRLA